MIEHSVILVRNVFRCLDPRWSGYDQIKKEFENDLRNTIFGKLNNAHTRSEATVQIQRTMDRLINQGLMKDGHVRESNGLFDIYVKPTYTSDIVNITVSLA